MTLEDLSAGFIQLNGKFEQSERQGMSTAQAVAYNVDLLNALISRVDVLVARATTMGPKISEF